MKINKNFLRLKDEYLFPVIERKTKEFAERNPDVKIIRLGIGDSTFPLVPAAVNAMQKALTEMQYKKTFRGYGPELGYDFLRKAVCLYYEKKHVSLMSGEVFISDGAGSDISNILDIFAKGSTVVIPNPSYPAYTDANIIAGNKIVYVNGNEDNNFLPEPHLTVKPDIIYLCSPNNPTGAVYDKARLKQWVDYAVENEAVIIFDSAYETFIRDKDLPSSIFQIENAKKCAIEIGSLSKTAGFTGVRCGYTVVPNELAVTLKDSKGKPKTVLLNSLWARRQTSKFNGVSYISQRGAEAVFTDKGLAETRNNIDFYIENARIITDTLKRLGIWFTGGDNAPYVWVKCFRGMSSRQMFDYLLEKCGIVCTPGVGFGSGDEGFFRITSFGNREDIIEAMRRIEELSSSEK